MGNQQVKRKNKSNIRNESSNNIIKNNKLASIKNESNIKNESSNNKLNNIKNKLSSNKIQKKYDNIFYVEPILNSNYDNSTTCHNFHNTTDTYYCGTDSHNFQSFSTD